MNKKSSIKEKLNILGGVLIVGFLLFGLARGVYNRNFADGKLHVIQEASEQISPIKHALFWHEQELEKLSGNHALSLEETYFIKPLYKSLEAAGLVSEELQTMSDKALHRMIELGAYSGDQTDVWALAKEYHYPYLFKLEITQVKRQRDGGLKNVIYLFSLYETSSQTLLWQAETERLAGFFGKMPGGEKTIELLIQHLQACNIIEQGYEGSFVPSAKIVRDKSYSIHYLRLSGYSCTGF